jgi:hypothetical protein
MNDLQVKPDLWPQQEHHDGVTELLGRLEPFQQQWDPQIVQVLHMTQCLCSSIITIKISPTSTPPRTLTCLLTQHGLFHGMGMGHKHWTTNKIVTNIYISRDTDL